MIAVKNADQEGLRQCVATNKKVMEHCGAAYKTYKTYFSF